MTTRWNRYYNRQLQDPEMKQMVKEELAALEVGILIAQLREKRGMNQTQLAALAGMSAPKISNLETSAKNIELGTLIRLAQALGVKLKVQFLPAKSGKRTRTHRARG